LTCPHCGHDKAWRNGHRNGKQRWLCTNCGREYAEGLTRDLNNAAPTLVLVGEAEKKRNALCGGADAKEEEKMSTEQVAVKSDLLKDFPEGIRAKILEFAVKRENLGLKDAHDITYDLKMIMRQGGNLYDPESVKAAISKMPVSESTKWLRALRYEAFLKFLGGKWERPKYRQASKMPFIPTEAELEQVIAACSPPVATALQIAKETGARKGEIGRLKWTDIDFERQIISINEPEKNSLPRLVNVSSQLIAMINKLPRKGTRLFPSISVLAHCYYIQRRRIAHKLNNPRIQQIGLHTFRHWVGTSEYHKTHSIVHVQQRLGHKSIQNTMVYITIDEALSGAANDEFHSATAATIEEARKLIESGFDYVTEISGTKLFRKRK
jgi:integrase